MTIENYKQPEITQTQRLDGTVENNTGLNWHRQNILETFEKLFVIRDNKGRIIDYSGRDLSNEERLDYFLSVSFEAYHNFKSAENPEQKVFYKRESRVALEEAQEIEENGERPLRIEKREEISIIGY